MAMEEETAAAVRAVRDRLLIELAELDRLGERFAAIEVNSAIELLNSQLGETTGAADIDELKRRYFRN